MKRPLPIQKLFVAQQSGKSITFEDIKISLERHVQKRIIFEAASFVRIARNLTPTITLQQCIVIVKLCKHVIDGDIIAPSEDAYLPFKCECTLVAYNMVRIRKELLNKNRQSGHASPQVKPKSDSVENIPEAEIVIGEVDDNDLSIARIVDDTLSKIPATPQKTSVELVGHLRELEDIAQYIPVSPVKILEALHSAISNNDPIDSNKVISLIINSKDQFSPSYLRQLEDLAKIGVKKTNYAKAYTMINEFAMTALEQFDGDEFNDLIDQAFI